MSTLCIELIKIFAQTGGACLVGLVTVKLAFSRYKREKLWERNFGVYSDIVSALRQLRATLLKWELHFKGARKLTEEEQTELRDNYANEKERLFNALSVGSIGLPLVDVAAIHVLFERMENRPFQTHELLEALEHEIEAIQNCYDYFIPIAREAIGSREIAKTPLFRTLRSWIAKN